MRALIFAMGPGEAGHGCSIANHLINQNHDVSMAFRIEANERIAASLAINRTFIAANPHDLEKAVSAAKPEVILICNSKAFGETTFAELRPWETPTFGVDSNWLFETTGPIRCIKWLDNYFVTFSEEIFQQGLIENGGSFKILPAMQPRIKPVGLIPSYDFPNEESRIKVRHALGIDPDEKLIFCYVSGRGADVRTYVLEHAVQAAEQLRKRGKKIKILALGSLDSIKNLSAFERSWVRMQKTMVDDYFGHLAASDLVFQHHGLVTVAQAISAQVPVIANVPSGSLFETEPGEVLPFYRSGLCEMLFDYSPPSEICDAMDELLFDEQRKEKMQQQQRIHHSRGEEHLVAHLTEQLRIL